MGEWGTRGKIVGWGTGGRIPDSGWGSKQGMGFQTGDVRKSNCCGKKLKYLFLNIG